MSLGRALLLGLCVASAPAWACAVCGEDVEELLGVSEDGILVIAADYSTGESDAKAMWGLRLWGPRGLVCGLAVDVSQLDESVRSASGPHPERCLRLPGTTRAQVASGARRVMKLEPLEPVAPPPVVLPLVEDADGYHEGGVRQPILLHGVEIASVGAGASHWFVTAHRHPRWDGLVLRVVTLLGGSEARTGASSSCTDYADLYLPITSRALKRASGASR